MTVFLYVTFTMHLNGSNLGPCHCLLDCGNGHRGEGKIIQSSYIRSKIWLNPVENGFLVTGGKHINKFTTSMLVSFLSFILHTKNCMNVLISDK